MLLGSLGRGLQGADAVLLMEKWCQMGFLGQLGDIQWRLGSVAGGRLWWSKNKNKFMRKEKTYQFKFK
jgi:hypothetical protein